MSLHLCHDFKTPRTDTSKRLPGIFIMVPILFYVILFGGSYIGVTSYMNYRNAVETRDQWQQFQAEQEEAKARLETEKTEVSIEKWRAEKLAQWVEGTRALQPISVAVSRAIPPEISLAEMSLERAPELPQQVTLRVRINNGTLDEVGKIQSAINSLNYRAYNNTQVKNGETRDFSTLMVWQTL
jgi:hypothetical protein